MLVAGGLDSSGALASAELYDPASGTWTATGSAEHRTLLITRRRCCPTARCWSRAAIAASGGYLSSAELYDPAIGMWKNGTGTFTFSRQVRRRGVDGELYGGGHGDQRDGLHLDRNHGDVCGGVGDGDQDGECDG